VATSATAMNNTHLLAQARKSVLNFVWIELAILLKARNLFAKKNAKKKT